jgi:hypothetical protein
MTTISSHCRSRAFVSLSGFLIGCLLPAYAGEKPAALRVAEPGWIVTAPDGVSAVERFALNKGIVDVLHATKAEEEVALADFPVAPGLRSGVRLTRRDVYAPGAVLWRVDGSGMTEIPRSRLAFLSGEADDAPHSRVLAIVDPDEGTMKTFVVTSDGWNVMEPDPGSPGDYVLAPSRALLGDAADRLSRDCGEESLDPVPGSPQSFTGGEPPGAPPPSGATAITALHDATIAVDTDNELMAQKFADSTTAATNYIASLIAFVSVIYERDLLVRTRQGTTYLRVSGAADPWAQSGTGNADNAKLTEFRSFWAANLGGVSRATTMLLSGKQSSGYSSSGIAYVNALCDKTYGYAFIQVFKFAGSDASSDVMVTAHEIGHNFGSRHTHCYLTPTPIDTCYAGEGSCYSGATSCPAPQTINGVANVRGTLMSYCHTLGGCGLSNVFHPRTMDLLDPIIEAKVGACILPMAPPPTPREASPAGQLRAQRGAGGSVSVTFAAACGATAHTIYAGSLSTLRAQGIVWSQRYCGLGISGSASFTPASGGQYFVVVGNNGTIEGSYGRASNGTERHAAGPGGACSYTQQLAGTCP